jgi:hypothetical protein
MRFTAKEDQLHKRNLDSNQVIPDENSRGWKNDAKKNLPGFRKLHEKFPDAEWYIMIDDDTYVFMENLRSLLDTLDPNEEHYLGAASNFIGCDGIKIWGNSIWFAHGGAGIVVSKGAMKKVLPLIDVCIPKYDSCWAGDIRWSLCMRDAGILVRHVAFFSPDAPNHRFDFSDPCASPKTFHHLLGNHIQKLFELEQVARQSSERVLMEDVMKAFMTNEPQVNVDRPGGKFLKHSPHKTLEECKLLCKETKKCVTYVYVNTDCYLKKSAPPVKRKADGVVTGLITENFNCLDRKKWAY